MSAQQDFAKEHGGDYVMSGDSFIFADGALLESGQWGAMEPPFLAGMANVDSRQIRRTLQRRLFYAQTKLGRAIRTFEVTKKNLEKGTQEALVQGSIPPEQNDIDDLQKLADEVRHFQDMVEAVELELNPPRPAVVVHINRENREQCKSALEKIQNIEV